MIGPPPKISISGWRGGQIDNEFARVLNGGQLYKQLENFKDKGILKVNDLVSNEATPVGLVTCFEKFDDGSGNGIEEYAIAGTRIYRKRGGTWSLIRTNTQTVTAGSMQFLKAYSNAAAATTKKALYYTSDGSLGYYYYDGATEQFVDAYGAFDNDDNKAHPMETKGGYLYIGDGNKIARIEPNGATFDPDALVITADYRCMSLKNYGNRLRIGTWRGVNIYDVAQARLVSWDGITGNEEEDIISLGECGITAMEEYENYLFVFAGVKGNIYKFNGATITKLPFSIKNVSRRVYVKPGAVGKFDGKLLFGVSDDDASLAETALQGVYCVSRRGAGEEFSITLDYLETGNATIRTQIGAIISDVAASKIIFSSYNNSAYRISSSSANSASLATQGEFDSQKYLWALGDNGETVAAFELLAKPLPSGTSVVINYKLDNASSWTTGPTINSTNQNLKHTIGSALGKILQIQVLLNTSGGSTPEIYNLNIY